ncbi:MAG TPA: electron transport complex subunit RsxB [Gammaproteobacteria bacterium]|nr:electron transport complex subunit RsxB [Gammaproteobacteria bacterium]
MKPHPTAEEIDAILPQTQCGLCTYKGCMPYAEALSKNEADINLCPPGGVSGLLAIADLLNKDAAPFIADMEKKAKPRSVVVIREAECIGCTKCIQACPVDAILGAAKSMHTVIADECTGCELCIAPCPVDCIDIVTLPETTDDRSPHYRKRYLARNVRLQQNSPSHPVLKTDKKAYIQAALQRMSAKQDKSSL